MDIESLSVNASQAFLKEQAGIAVAKMAMDSASQDAADLTKMMELSVNPSIGKNFDQSV